MYTILVPVDDDENRSRTQADFVASLPLDEDVVRVVLTHSFREGATEVPESMRSAGRVETVRAARSDLEAAGYDVDVAEAESPPADGILALAEDVDADLIVMGGRKRSPAGKALFGSITQAIFLDADVPVAVTGGTAPE